MARFKAALWAHDESNKSGRSKVGKTATVEADDIVDAASKVIGLVSDLDDEKIATLSRVQITAEEPASTEGNPFAGDSDEDEDEDEE